MCAEPAVVGIASMPGLACPCSVKQVADRMVLPRLLSRIPSRCFHVFTQEAVSLRRKLMGVAPF